MEEYILLIDTEDAKGLVYNVSKVLFANNLNIEQNAEYVDKDTNKFFMRTVISGNVSRNILLKELTEVLPKNAQIKLNKKAKKDVVILATKDEWVLGIPPIPSNSLDMFIFLYLIVSIIVLTI